MHAGPRPASRAGGKVSRTPAEEGGPRDAGGQGSGWFRRKFWSCCVLRVPLNRAGPCADTVTEHAGGPGKRHSAVFRMTPGKVFKPPRCREGRGQVLAPSVGRQGRVPRGCWAARPRARGSGCACWSGLRTHPPTASPQTRVLGKQQNITVNNQNPTPLIKSRQTPLDLGDAAPSRGRLTGAVLFWPLQRGRAAKTPCGV